MHSRLSVDDIHKRRLQARASNKEAVNILLLGQLPAVLLTDRSAIDDARLLGRLAADLLGQPHADGGVHLLRLLRAGDLAGANGPDGLVGNDDLAPVRYLLGDGAELGRDDVDGLLGLALLERLAAAEDDADAAVQGRLGLAADEAVRLLQDDAALAVAQQRPGDVGVLELADGDFAREGAVGLVEDVLRGDFEAWAQVLASQEEVEGRGCEDDFDFLVDFGVVEVLDDALDGVDVSIPVR